MTISTQGGLNQSALVIPDIYLNIQPPPAVPLNGVPSNVLGIVGTATWGPVNSPALLGSLSDYVALFGPVQARKYDGGTILATAQLQGANVFRFVRVTDGTDAAATVQIQSTCLTLNAKYTGARGNLLQGTIAAGTAPSSFKITLALPGLQPETFDNITGSGNALWVNIAAAINGGQSAQRGPSQIATATAGVGTTAPTLATYTLAGGADGVATITGAVMVGVDTTPRSGMYALRGTGCAVIVLADCDTSSTWSTQLAYALSEQCEAFAVSPASDTISSITTAQTNDNPWLKVIFGDWVYWLDTTNNITRLVSPQGFLAGKKVAIGPAQSVLNKALAGVVGTQRSYANQQYSTAELQALAGARVDVIANPCPGGNYFGARFGRNTSSDPVRRQDSYTTLTNYIATTINAGGGKFVGELLTPDEQREARSAIGGFLQVMADQNPPMIGNATGTVPYSVTISSGAPGTGTQKAVVMVQYFDVIEFMIVDLTGGASVQILSQSAA